MTVSRRRPGPSDAGILAGPIDLDGPRRPRVDYREVEATPGLVVRPRGGRSDGVVIETTAVAVLVRDRHGREHWMRFQRGGFVIDDQPVTLVPPRSDPARHPAAAQRTASGSVAMPSAPGRGRREARVARASRILVEGTHDAELVEKVWGDDLRAEGVVVELLHGADHLTEVVRGFGPRPGRRLGVLLDHLVDGSKETRLAAEVDHPDVLIVGHPYIDIWQAVKPAALGLDRWPEVPPGRPWKEGVLAALGQDVEPGRFWRQLLGAVDSWLDLEPPLIGAVEQLIDFVTSPPPG